MTEKWSDLIVRYRWLWLIGSLIAVGMLASGGQHLGFSSNYRVFFAEGNPQLTAFDNIQAEYTKSDNVLFVVTPANGKVFHPDSLQAIHELTERGWQLPFSTRVDSITNYQHTIAEADDLLVEDLIDIDHNYTAAELADRQAIAVSEQLLINRLINPDASVTGVNVTINIPGVSETETPTVVKAVRDLQQEFMAKYPGLEIHLTGIVMLNNAFGEAAQGDMMSLVPIMFALVIVTLALLLKSPLSTLATVVVIFFSIAIAMGITGWIGWELSGPSSSAPIIILTIAVADCVHILVTFIHSMREGNSKFDAIRDSLRVNFQPIFITSLTTVIGFLSMNFSTVPPLVDLGNIVAMGVVAAFVLSVTFLPALLAILPMRIKAQKDKPEANNRNGMAALAEFVITNRKVLFVTTGLITLGLVALAPNNEVNDRFVHYFAKSIDFRADTDYTNENLTGIYTVQYSLGAEAYDNISDPRFLAKVESLSQWLRSFPDVVHVSTVTDIFKRLNQNLHGDDPSYYRLPENRELASQYLLLYEMSLPFGLDLNNQINMEKSATKIVITFNDTSSKRMLELEQQINQWLATNAPEINAFGASPNLMFSHIGKMNVESMVVGAFIAVALISIILILALRSVKLGIISLIPNVMPVGAAFGIWALIDGQVGLGLSTAIGMTMGIVVDDTVHFLSKYLRARREMNLNSAEAVRYAFNTVGVALWVTSFVLIAGFLVLASSSFAMNASIGVVTAITIAMALFVDFLFLAPLLMKIEGTKQEEEEQKAQSALAAGASPAPTP